MRTIRRITSDDVELYRRVRLASLEDSPEAFCSTFQDALSRSEESWKEQVESAASGPDQAIFVVMDDEPVGLAAFYRDGKDPELGELMQVWIAPEKRGGAAASDLIHEVLAWAASSGVARVKAEVLGGNLRALRFYQKHGFVESLQEETQSDCGVILTRQVG